MLAAPEAEHLDVSDSDGATGRWDFAHRAFEHAVVRPRECALLDCDVVDNMKAVHVDVCVGEGAEPAAVNSMQAAFPSPRNPPGASKTTSSASTSANPSISWALNVSVPLSNASRAVIVIENLLGRWPDHLDVYPARLRIGKQRHDISTGCVAQHGRFFANYLADMQKRRAQV